jgi:hypothetical protein
LPSENITIKVHATGLEVCYKKELREVIGGNEEEEEAWESLRKKEEEE